MKEIARFLSALGKFFVLGVFLVGGWALLNIVNAIKGKEEGRLPNPADLFKPPKAHADAPADGSPGGSKGSSTPFLAYFDGERYNIENDILFGRPKSYYPDYAVAKSLYEDGRISPDFYKIAAPIAAIDGKLKFQIQEIEIEESFIKWLELKKITHSAESEVLVDSEYKKFYVLNKDELEKNLDLPAEVRMHDGVGDGRTILDKKFVWSGVKNAGIKFSGSKVMDFVFKDLKKGEVPYLVVKSWFRDWVLGMEEEWSMNKSLNRSPWTPLAVSLKWITRVASVFLVFYLWKNKFTEVATLTTPFIIGDSGATGGDSAGDSAGAQCGCSFVYEYKKEDGHYAKATVSEPRAWHYNTEVIELPREAVLPTGELHLRIKSSKNHVLGFVGAIQDIDAYAAKYEVENLPLESAVHSRMSNPVKQILENQEGEYVHLIPGDTVSLEFQKSRRPGGMAKKETYLMRASGFYTALRPESRALAGDWQSRISSEARERLATLRPLRTYALHQ